MNPGISRFGMARLGGRGRVNFGIFDNRRRRAEFFARPMEAEPITAR